MIGRPRRRRAGGGEHELRRRRQRRHRRRRAGRRSATASPSPSPPGTRRQGGGQAPAPRRRVPAAVTVGATDITDKKTSLSNYGIVRRHLRPRRQHRLRLRRQPAAHTAWIADVGHLDGGAARRRGGRPAPLRRPTSHPGARCSKALVDVATTNVVTSSNTTNPKLLYSPSNLVLRAGCRRPRHDPADRDPADPTPPPTPLTPSARDEALHHLLLSPLIGGERPRVGGSPGPKAT